MTDVTITTEELSALAAKVDEFVTQLSPKERTFLMEVLVAAAGRTEPESEVAGFRMASSATSEAAEKLLELVRFEPSD